MANDAISNAYGGRGLQRQYGGGGGSSGPRSSFDANTPAGVDPEGLWRFGNTDRYRRTGATSAERAGAVPGYTPGYGRSSNRNAGGSMGGGASSLTPKAQWDAQFQPQLGPMMQQLRHGVQDTPAPQVFPDNPAATAAAAEAARANGYQGAPTAPAPSPVLPPATPPPASPGLPVLPPSPGIQQTDGSQSSVRAATGLPPGQTANATFVPGQNNPQNLSKRTRPPVDPLAV